MREDIHSRHRIRKEIVLVVRAEKLRCERHGRRFGGSPAAAPSEPKGFVSDVMESRVGARSVRLAVYWPCAIFGLAILNGSDDLIGKRSEEEPSGVWRKVGAQCQAEYEVKCDAGGDCNSGRIHFPCPLFLRTDVGLPGLSVVGTWAAKMVPLSLERGRHRL